MGSKTHLLLSLNLLYFILSATTTAGDGVPATPPPPPPAPVMAARCPRDALKLGVCANLLGNVVGVEVGKPRTSPCCGLVAGLIDLEVAACFCTAIRANVLGINLNVSLSLSLLLAACGTTPPPGFTC